MGGLYAECEHRRRGSMSPHRRPWIGTRVGEIAKDNPKLQDNFMTLHQNFIGSVYDRSFISGNIRSGWYRDSLGSGTGRHLKTTRLIRWNFKVPLRSIIDECPKANDLWLGSTQFRSGASPWS